jgi:hypothetical protein
MDNNVLAFNPNISNTPAGLERPETGTGPQGQPPTGGSVNEPPRGSLAQLPRTQAAAAFSQPERAARWEAARENKFNDGDANRWMYLERMEVNAARTNPKDSTQLQQYTANLQDKLEIESRTVDKYRDYEASLKADGWSNLPGSREWHDLRQVRQELSESVAQLNSTRAEIDRLLQRPSSLEFYRDPIDVKAR